jgi:hypothetical protein
MAHMWMKSVIANESCVDSGFGCTAKRHDMEMLIHLTEQLFAPRRWIAFGDGERRDLVVVDQENRRRGFPCIHVMDATRRIRMLGRCARDSELNGRIAWTADRMANRWAVALPRVAGLHNARTDERAVFFGQVHAGEGHVSSAIEQIKSRVGQRLIKKMGVVTGVGGRINIGRNALEPTKKRKCCDRNNAGTGLPSSNHHQIRTGADAIQRADGLSLFRAERLAATRFADIICEPPRSAKDMTVARFVGVRQEVARRAGLNLRVGKLQRLRVRRHFAFAHTLPSAELCERRTQNFAQLGDAPHFAIGPLAIHAPENSIVGRTFVHQTKILRPLFHALAAEQLKNSSSADALLSRLRSPANPNTAFSAIHGAFHTRNLESTGINHEAWCGISGCCNAKRKAHLTNVLLEVKVSRLVNYMFQRRPSAQQESKDGGESFMCFGPESSRDARDGFAETWRRGTDVYRGLRSLRQRVKARVLDIAQEVGHGQRGFAKRAVVVEHPSSQHCLGGFFEPLVDQNSNFSPQIRGVIESGQFKRLQ